MYPYYYTLYQYGSILEAGLMRTWDRFRDLGLKPILPPESENPERDCIGRPRNLFCFIAGDERVNEQIHLTVLHTFYVRDHNRFVIYVSNNIIKFLKLNRNVN